MKEKILFLLILSLSFFLRVYNLQSNPPGLYWDEVSIGYNAWSLSQTGADEYGERHPFLFEAFQEYKLPGFIYSVLPFVKMSGMNELSIRFPAVLYSLMLVWLLYLSVSLLFDKKVALLSA